MCIIDILFFIQYKILNRVSHASTKLGKHVIYGPKYTISYTNTKKGHAQGRTHAH